MSPVVWPISPWFIIAPALALLAVCVLLLVIAWRLRLPWLRRVVEFLLPDDPDERPRRRRRRHHD
jgi:hypothetical protein